MRVADSTSIASRIEQAFQTASKSTGTSFDYLVKTAARESSFDPQAKAGTSSATGLFQFIESTWLETVKEAGPEHGLGEYADQIERTSGGKYLVQDAQMRKEILDLRKDPEVASVMAGALTQKNASQLNRTLGREPSEGELYMAHFLGASGANRLITAAAVDSDMQADALFPVQAQANKTIFYHSDGTARTTSEVYDAIVSKHDGISMIAGLTGSGGTQSASWFHGLTDVAAVPAAKPGTDDLAGQAIAAAEVSAEDFPADLDEATRRVLSAFQATETANPFEALFRNDPGSETAGVKSRLLSAFTTTTENRYFSSASSQVAVQEMAAVEGRAPLDLTRFLRLNDDNEQRDVLPPA